METILAEAREISMRDANQGFAKLIREVESGEEVVITRRGSPVARLVPVRGRKRVLTPAQEAAIQDAEAVIDQGWELGASPIDRDELHER